MIHPAMVVKNCFRIGNVLKNATIRDIRDKPVFSLKNVLKK